MLSTLEVAQAQQRLAAGVADLDDEALRQPSHCDGWTRAHVLTHVARNADGMVNLVTWARTGEVTPMYAAGSRDDDIEAGATRTADEIRTDLVASNDRLLAALAWLERAAAVDPSVARRRVRLGADPERGTPVAVGDLAFLRVQEVVLHHHDLLHDLGVEEWPAAFVARALPDTVARMAARVDDLPTLVAREGAERRVVHEGGTVEVTASPAHLLLWLTGRAQPRDLDLLAVTGGPLPTLPPW